MNVNNPLYRVTKSLYDTIILSRTIKFIDESINDKLSFKEKVNIMNKKEIYDEVEKQIPKEFKSDLSEFKNQHKEVEELRDKIQSSLIQSGIISDKKQITGSESGDSEWESGTCPYADFDIEIDNKLYCIQVTDLTKDFEHYVSNLEKEGA